MLGVSLRYRGAELIAMPRGLDVYRAGGSTGMPLLHPWANRLSQYEYRVGNQTVDLRDTGIATDHNNLPIHGTMQGQPFAVTEGRAEFDFGARAELLRTFPFPHRIAIVPRIAANALTVTTEIVNTGSVPMPISFGWHPFFTLPARPRGDWSLRIPRCDRHVLDARLIPTGATVEQPESHAPIGDRTYDDHFALGDDRRFVVEAGAVSISIEFDRNYPHAQMYLPGPNASLTGDFVCIEPMTAPTNAIVAGTAPILAPNTTFTASFTVTIVST